MTKTLIVYEDGAPELESCAKLVASGLPESGYEVRLRAASSVSIPEILASKLYFFGATGPSPASYAEIARVFKGVNLAGRTAAYFGLSGAAVESLKAMARDTDLGVAGSDLVAAPEFRPEAVSAWLRGLI